jgi:vacuolar-type H+-ATPase subunit E/Vma4
LAESGIVSKILQTAKERGESLLKEAEARRDAEIEKGLEVLKSEFDGRRQGARKRDAEALDQELSAFRLVERNSVKLLKRKLLDGVYEDAWGRALEPTAYRRWIEARMKEYCIAGDVLVAPAGQAELFADDFKDMLSRYKVSLSDEKGTFRAGFIVIRGNLRFNCTLDEEMKVAVRGCEAEISRHLFG